MMKVKNKRNLGFITFDFSKVTKFDCSDFKVCFRKLCFMGFTAAVNKGPIKPELLAKSDILVLMGPSENFSVEEITLLWKYVDEGGKLLVTDYCGKSTNINLLLDFFGMRFRNDSVYRTQRHRNYYHPCESFISDGVVNKSVYSLAERARSGVCSMVTKSFPILYPYGCTLDVKSPSVILMSTGSVCCPFNRPICAFNSDPSKTGRILAVGSTAVFSDSYICKEQNSRFFQTLLLLLTEDTVRLNLSDAQFPDVSEHYTIPDIAGLSASPLCCLQDTEQIPSDSDLFGDGVFSIDNRHYVKVLEAYRRLSTEHKNLKVIKPKFESPLPQIMPAVVPPRFRDLVHPTLELLDLDGAFRTADYRLDCLTFKCTDDDLEYYVLECGTQVFGLRWRQNAKYVLYYVCNELASYKRNRVLRQSKEFGRF